MYNKLFGKILDSSIWMESTETRIVWVMFLASMDETGYVRLASVKNVAHRSVVSLESAEAAIGCLESADKYSSDPENEGRRIEKVDGGWIVLNADKYRQIATREHERALNRKRVANCRKRNELVMLRNASGALGNDSVMRANGCVTPSDTDTEADTDTDTDTDQPTPDSSNSKAQRKTETYVPFANGTGSGVADGHPMQESTQVDEECARDVQTENRSKVSPNSSGRDTRKARPLKIDPRKGEIDEVVAHYQSIHPRSKPGAKERKLIGDRLAEGRTARDLCQAIDGQHVTPHNLGANETGTKYLGLDLAVRSASHVDRYLEAAESPPHRNGNGKVVAAPEVAFGARMTSDERSRGVTLDQFRLGAELVEVLFCHGDDEQSSTAKQWFFDHGTTPIGRAPDTGHILLRQAEIVVPKFYRYMQSDHTKTTAADQSVTK